MNSNNNNKIFCKECNKYITIKYMNKSKGHLQSKIHLKKVEKYNNRNVVLKNNMIKDLEIIYEKYGKDIVKKEVGKKIDYRKMIGDNCWDIIMDYKKQFELRDIMDNNGMINEDYVITFGTGIILGNWGGEYWIKDYVVKLGDIETEQLIKLTKDFKKLGYVDKIDINNNNNECIMYGDFINEDGKCVMVGGRGTYYLKDNDNCSFEISDMGINVSDKDMEYLSCKVVIENNEIKLKIIDGHYWVS